MQQVLITIVTILAAVGLILYIFFNVLPDHYAKNKIKQEKKERRKIDELFNEAPTGFIQRNCEERCYKDFADTQMMEEVV